MIASALRPGAGERVRTRRPARSFVSRSHHRDDVAPDGARASALVLAGRVVVAGSPQRSGAPVGDADLLAARTELARHCNRESIQYIPARLVVVATVAVALWSRLDHGPLLWWMAAACTDSLRGLVVARHQLRRLEDRPADAGWVLRDAPNWLSFGAVYGAMPVIARLWGTPTAFVIALLLAFGVAATVAVCGVVFRTHFYCAVAALLVPAIVVGTLASPDLRVLGLLAVLYLVALVVCHQRMTTALVMWNALRTANERLSTQLVTERDRARSANDKLRAANARLAHEAGHDPLTGVANRARLVECVDGALDSAHRMGTTVGLLYIDLDHFKPINDRYGHAVGDQLLAAAAERMRDVVGDDHLVARMGGDEFVVLVRDVSTPATAVVLAGHLHRAITAPYTLREAVVSVGASIGHVVAAVHDSAETLIRAADEALYRAKAAGRNQVLAAAPDTCAGLDLDAGIDVVADADIAGAAGAAGATGEDAGDDVVSGGLWQSPRARRAGGLGLLAVPTHVVLRQ